VAECWVVAVSTEHLIYFASNNGLLRKYHHINLEMFAVLLSMLEHANSRTGEISVGVRRLVEETGLWTRSVTTAIDKLVLYGAIEQIEKVKHGRTWVNAYRPTLFGMPTNTATNTATSSVTRTVTSSVTRTVDDSCDAYGVERNRDSVFPQVIGENRNFQISEESLQPKPKPKSEPKPEAHSEENGLGFEAIERILEYAVNLSLKKCPPILPAGERLLAKKKREFERHLHRVLPKIPQNIINLCNTNPSCIKAQMIGEYIQCRFEDSVVPQGVIDAIFSEPYPAAMDQFTSVFKTNDDE
jgi:hypothetical protein